jgi:nucleoside-diphosphate-sugar epimerase
MKVLITGAAGRLGYEAVRLSTQQGYSVNAFDLPQVNWSHLDALGVETIKGDITNLFNEDYAYVNGYPMPGRSFYLGLRYDI